MAKKKLASEDYWAQQIIRAQSGGKDYIFALVRRKYSDDEENVIITIDTDTEDELGDDIQKDIKSKDIANCNDYFSIVQKVFGIDSLPSVLFKNSENK